jgi:hypothetical protein
MANATTGASAVPGATTGAASGNMPGVVGEQLAVPGASVPADTSIYTGATPTAMPNPLPDQIIPPSGGAPSGIGGLVGRLISKGGDWLEKHPTAAGYAVGGIGSGVGSYLAAQRKSEGELALAEKHKQNSIELAQLMPKIVQASSAGGAGTSLNFMPGDLDLKRPDGSSVYKQGGLIRRRMGG